MKVTRGMNLRDAIDAARELGVSVESVRRTGELRFEVMIDGAPKRLVHNARRKDASAALVGFLRRLEKIG